MPSSVGQAECIGQAEPEGNPATGYQTNIVAEQYIHSAHR